MTRVPPEEAAVECTFAPLEPAPRPNAAPDNCPDPCLVIRPPIPVPLTCARSILFSRAIFRTSGESGPAVSSTIAASAAAGGADGAAGAACRLRSGAAEPGQRAEPPQPAPSAIRPTIVLIPTVLPSSTRISVSVPADGDGISVSTLSVEISNSGSSRSTCSPAFFNHLVRVPSTMLSPIWGMTTSIIISPYVRLKTRPKLRFSVDDDFCARGR